MMFVRCLGTTYCMEGLVTGQEAVERARERLGLPEGLPWRVEQNGRPVSPLSPLSPGSPHVSLQPCPGLKGGKGGFGSLLRAIGAQIEATTNHEAMRDLSGRRQRDINNERRLKEYVEGTAERERLEREKKEAKLEKLRQVAQGKIHNRDKHSFSDPAYDKARGEVEEKVHDAVEAAMAAGGERSLKEVAEAAGGSGAELKRKGEAEKGPEQKKPKGLWMGGGLDDLDDEDLTDSSDEEAEGGKAVVAVK